MTQAEEQQVVRADQPVVTRARRQRLDVARALLGRTPFSQVIRCSLFGASSVCRWRRFCPQITGRVHLL